MDFEEIISTIAVIAVVICTMIMIITCIWDVVKSNKSYKEEVAYLNLMRTTFQKEHKLLKAVQGYGEWLEFYHKTMSTNLELEHTDFNDGVLSAAEDCMQMFTNTFNEYVGEVKNDIDIGTRN